MATTELTSMLQACIAFSVGAVVGTVFYGGLWWTVSRGLRSEQPGLWFMGSFLARTAAAALGILLVAQGRLDRFALCMLGFFCARAVITRRLRPPTQQIGRQEHAH